MQRSIQTKEFLFYRSISQLQFELIAQREDEHLIVIAVVLDRACEADIIAGIERDVAELIRQADGDRQVKRV